MPYDTSPLQRIQTAPLTGLFRNGSWQVELAHERDHHLLVWITRGQGRALMDGHRQGFGAHHALFIPAGRLMAIEFGRGCLGQYMVVPSTNAIALPHRSHHLRITNSTDQTSLTALLDVMQREQNVQDALWQRSIQAYGELVGILLLRQIQETDQAKVRQKAARRLTHTYFARVSQLYRENQTVADHALALGVTATHLSRAVKSQTGSTAANILMERQLYAARCLLLDGELPIQEVAAQLNFSSAAYFTRFITQHTGQSPSSLRKLAHI